MATADGSDDFFKKDTPHGLVKRFMWKKHVQTFIPRTQQSRCYITTIIFDGFAGAGRYGSKNEWPDEIEKFGSPLISLKVAINFHLASFRRNTKQYNAYSFNPEINIPHIIIKDLPYVSNFHKFHCEKIQLYFVERNKKNYNKLVNNVIALFLKHNINVNISKIGNEIFVTSSDENIPVGCKIINACFEDVEVPIMGKRDIMTSFIDPYGYTQIPMKKIKDFTGTSKEVFINLMTQHINRFKDVGSQGLEKLFGLKHRDILKRLDNYKDDGVIERFAKLYIDVLEEKTDVKYHLSFEMRNKGNVPLFHMIFASKHEAGFNSMKEAMNRGTQSEGAFSVSDYLIVKKKQELSLGNDQNDEHVAYTIYQEFKGVVDVSFADIKNFIMFETIFVWRTKPLKILEIEQKLMKCFYTKKEEKEKERRKGTYNDEKYEFTFDFENRDF